MSFFARSNTTECNCYVVVIHYQLIMSLPSCIFSFILYPFLVALKKKKETHQKCSNVTLSAFYRTSEKQRIKKNAAESEISLSLWLTGIYITHNAERLEIWFIMRALANANSSCSPQTDKVRLTDVRWTCFFFSPDSNDISQSNVSLYLFIHLFMTTNPSLEPQKAVRNVFLFLFFTYAVLLSMICKLKEVTLHRQINHRFNRSELTRLLFLVIPAILAEMDDPFCQASMWTLILWTCGHWSQSLTFASLG